MKSVKLTRIISYFKSFFMHFHFTRYVKNTFPAAVNISSASVSVFRYVVPSAGSNITTLLLSYPIISTASVLPVMENTGLPQLT